MKQTFPDVTLLKASAVPPECLSFMLDIQLSFVQSVFGLDQTPTLLGLRFQKKPLFHKIFDNFDN